MQNAHSWLLIKRSLSILIAIFSFFMIPVSLAKADPPSRVARLAQIKGEMSFLPAGFKEWLEGMNNRPLTIGDKLWTAQGASAKLQLGAATLCLGDSTYLNIFNLNDQIGQFQMTQGLVNLRVNQIEPNQEFEIDTPNLALTIKKPGNYLIEVNVEEGWTAITVIAGLAVASGEQASYIIDPKKSYRFAGTALADYETITPLKETLDKWCKEDEGPKPRMKRSDRYVSREVIGYEDLDRYGEWKQNDEYGYVWQPSSVSQQWVPYAFGQWTWIEPWGWTWIDDAPWGFAPFHYGRWILLENNWSWVPGPLEVSPVYAPALVEFIVLENEIAWFALAPREYYWPPYATNKAYFVTLNSSNTKLSPAELSQIFGQPRKPQTFSNLEASKKAVLSLPSSQFAEAGNVGSIAKRLSPEAISKGKGKYTSIAPIAPTRKSVMGTAAVATAIPNNALLEKQTIAKRTPISPSLVFDQKQNKLQSLQGRSLMTEDSKKLKPETTPVNVKMINAQTPSVPEKDKLGTMPPRTHKKPEKPEKSEKKGKTEKADNGDKQNKPAKTRSYNKPETNRWRDDGWRDDRYRQDRYRDDRYRGDQYRSYDWRGDD